MKINLPLMKQFPSFLSMGKVISFSSIKGAVLFGKGRSRFLKALRMNVKHMTALGSLQSSHCVTIHLGLFVLSFQFISLHNNDPKDGCHFANTIWLNFDEGFELL